MSDFFTTIAGIEPSAADVQAAELFAKQVLSSKYPDLDLREGTGLRDLVLRPNALLLAMIKKGLEYYFEQRTIGSVTNDTSEEIVDDLLSNFFLTRKTGDYSIINARLYFAKQKSVSLSSATSFSTDGALLFYPSESLTVSANSLSYDNDKKEWYFDINLVAAEIGTSYNLTSGSLLYFANFDVYFLHAEINYLVSESLNAETNLEFVARAESAISTRNLINTPSIKAKLEADLNYAKNVVVVGKSDPLMHRDQLEIAGRTYSSRVGYGSFYSPTITEVDLTYGEVLSISGSSSGLVEGQTVIISETEVGAPEGADLLVGVYSTVLRIMSSGSYLLEMNGLVTPRALGTLSLLPYTGPMMARVGGCVDIYANSHIYTETEELTFDSNGEAVITGPVVSVSRAYTSTDTLPEAAVFTSYSSGLIIKTQVLCSLESSNILITTSLHGLSEGRLVKLTGFPNSDSIGYFRVLEVRDSDTAVLSANLDAATTTLGTLTSQSFSVDTWGTADHQHTVKCASGAGLVGSFHVTKFMYQSSIQEYLNSKANKVVCADYRAKGNSIYFLDFSFDIYSSYSSGEVYEAITTYLDGLLPGDPFIVANLITTLANSSITDLKLPISITATYYGIDGLEGVTSSIAGALNPDESVAVFKLRDIDLNLVSL